MEAVKQKVCSLHFKPDDFEFIVLGKKRAALLNTAIPPIFPFPYDDELHGVAANGSAKRIFWRSLCACIRRVDKQIIPLLNEVKPSERDVHRHQNERVHNNVHQAVIQYVQFTFAKILTSSGTTLMTASAQFLALQDPFQKVSVGC